MRGDYCFRFTFTVPGRPVPFVRATGLQYRVQKNKAIKRYMDYKSDVGWEAKAAGVELIDGPVWLRVWIFLPDRTKRRWDGVNVYKTVEDALNKIAYHDDKQVVMGEFQIANATGDPYVRVTIHELPHKREESK